MSPFVVATARFVVLAALVATTAGRLARAADIPDAPPEVGQAAPDFELQDIGGKSIKLTALTKKGPVVLVVLRGYPGYQCPLCTAQVGQFLSRAKDFKAARASVVLVYPAKASDVTGKAKEFIAGKELPANFHLVVDPDFRFANAYHLRWEAPSETTYPSTFLIDADGKITLAKISHTHGDRASASEVLKQLGQK